MPEKIYNWVRFFTIIEDRETLVSQFSFTSKKKADKFFDDNYGQCLIDGIKPRITYKCGCIYTKYYDKENEQHKVERMYNCLGH